MRWISLRENNCVVHWIWIYPGDSVIYFLNNSGAYDALKLLSLCAKSYELKLLAKISRGASFFSVFDTMKFKPHVPLILTDFRFRQPKLNSG